MGRNYTNGKKSGTLKFNIPNKIGECEWRYYNKNNVLIDRSESFRIGAKVELEVSKKLNKIFVTPKISFLDHGNWKPTNTDKICLYKSDSKQKWNELATKPTDKPTLTFDVPTEPGTYLFKYYNNYIPSWECGISEPFTISSEYVSDDTFSEQLVHFQNASLSMSLTIVNSRVYWTFVDGKHWVEQVENEESQNNNDNEKESMNNDQNK